MPARRAGGAWFGLVVFGLGCRRLLGALRLRLCCLLSRGLCCAGGCPPPLLGGPVFVPAPSLMGCAVCACSGFGSWCCSRLDARLVLLVRCCLRCRTAGDVGCWLSVVFAWPGLVLCWCVPPPLCSGLLCLFVPHPMVGLAVLVCAPPLVGRAALVCGPRHGRAWSVGAWPPSWCGVLCWCLPAAVVVFGLGCRRLFGGLRLRLCCLLGRGWCCDGACPPPPLLEQLCLCMAPLWWGVLCRRVRVSVRGVVAGSMLGLFCLSLLSAPQYGQRCWVLVVCGVCLAGTDEPASGACVVRNPFVLAVSDKPASRARAVRQPVFLFSGCRRPAARVHLLALCFLVSARLLAMRWCLSPPAAVPPPPYPTRPRPSACCLLPTPLLLGVLFPPAVVPRPLPAWGLHFAAGGVLLRVYPCCLRALWLLCAAVPLVGASCCPALPRGFVFRGCCHPASRLPLFSLCLPVVSHRSAVCSPPDPPCLCFLAVVALPLVFLCPPAAALFFPVPLALAPVWLGFFFPPRPAAFLRSVRCVLVSCPPPPRRLLLVVCGAPRLVVRCRGWVWAVLCGARCFAVPCCAGVRVPCCVVCCSIVLLVLSLAVPRGRWPGCFCRCRTVLCCALLFCAVFHRVWCRRPLSCAVVLSSLLCGVVVVALFSLCLLGFAHLLVCAAWCCPPPPGLCVVPSAGLCCRAVLASSVLCVAVFLLAVLCCSGCGVPCGVVPCHVVLRGCCGAALGFHL